jgi:hypothetical protein
MPRRLVAVSLLALLLSAAVAACGGEASASFDPTGPCATDGTMAGAYPELEARIPTTYEDQAPATLDSGRNCSDENLGSLKDEGITEVRYAGGTWDFGGNRAAALAIFTAPGLTPDMVFDFYRTSAEAANRTTITGESTPTLAGHDVQRLDSKTGERIQTVVVWASDAADIVNVVLTNDLPDPKIESAVAAFDR